MSTPTPSTPSSSATPPTARTPSTNHPIQPTAAGSMAASSGPGTSPTNPTLPGRSGSEHWPERACHPPGRYPATCGRGTFNLIALPCLTVTKGLNASACRPYSRPRASGRRARSSATTFTRPATKEFWSPPPLARLIATLSSSGRAARWLAAPLNRRRPPSPASHPYPKACGPDLNAQGRGLGDLTGVGTTCAHPGSPGRLAAARVAVSCGW